VSLVINIVWSFLMIAHILCGLFLCGSNLILSSQFGRTIKVVQCDNGREFDNTSSRAFFVPNVVVLQMSYPYTSPWNGKIERTLHSINNIIRSLLFKLLFQHVTG
jgi:hypothetical protein